jgi:hypothetical protein
MFDIAQNIYINGPTLYGDENAQNDLSSEIILINEIVRNYLKRNEAALRAGIALSGPLQIDLDYNARTQTALPPLVPNADIFSHNRDYYTMPDVVASQDGSGHIVAFVIMQSYDPDMQASGAPVFLDAIPLSLYKTGGDIRIGYAPLGNAVDNTIPLFGPLDLGRLPIRIEPGSLIEQITLQ